MFQKVSVLIFGILLSVFYSVNSAEAATNGDIESNNDLRTAGKISLNISYKGLLTGGSDEDYYKFTITKPGNVTFNLRNDNDNKTMSIYDTTGNVFTSIENNHSLLGNSSTQIGLPAGTYYIRIGDYPGYNIPYQFSVNFTASNYYEKEWNNSLRQANLIVLNHTYKGLLQDGSDQDFYKFNLPSAGNVEFQMGNAGLSKTMSIYDQNGNQFTSFETKEGYEGKSSVQLGLPAGTYYFKIGDYPSTNVSYDFLVKFTKSSFYEKEWNDSFSQANGIMFNQTYKGLLQGGSDNDYYKFTMPSAGGVTFEMSNASPYKSMYIYDYNGNELGNFTTNDQLSGNTSIQLSLAKGNYYIKIADYPGTFVPYQFKVKTSLPTTAPSPNQVVVTNHTGSSDVVTVNKLKVGDVVRIYNQGGSLIGTSKAVADGQSSASVSIKQLGTSKGKIYVSLQNYGMKVSTKREIIFPAEKISGALLSSQIKVSNNRGKYDTVDVNGLHTGDVIKVYDSKGKSLGTSKSVAKGQSTATVSIKQLGTKSGSVWVSVINPGKLESKKTAKSYAAELSSTPPSVGNVSAVVTLTVNHLKAGDVVKVYNEAGKIIMTSKPVAKGKTSVTVSVTKQVGKQEKVYLTVTSTGSEESTKVVINI